MRLSIFLITCSLFQQAPIVSLQGNTWRGITPLRSTRAHVEKLIGNPTKPALSVYETKDALIHVVYSKNPCEDGIAGRWNIPPDTIISFEVNPKKDVYIEDLNIDESKFRVITSEHISSLTSYVNDDLGITVKARYEKIITVHYAPTTHDKHLMCSVSAP